MAVARGEFKHALGFLKLKQGKDFRLSSYRPLSFASYVGKLLKRLVLCRLQCFLENASRLPPGLFGFRRERGITDCIADLAFVLEYFGHCKETAITVFLNIKRPFDSVLHDVILPKLSHLGITGNIFRFFVSIFCDRTYCVRLSAITSSVCQLCQSSPG